jgi:hypothetical protein
MPNPDSSVPRLPQKGAMAAVLAQRGNARERHIEDNQRAFSNRDEATVIAARGLSPFSSSNMISMSFGSYP